MLGEGLEVEKRLNYSAFLYRSVFQQRFGQTLRTNVVEPGKEGGGPEGGEDFFGRGSERRGSGPE